MRARKIASLGLSILMALALAGCGTAWVSDRAKEASGEAHRQLQSQEKWPESVEWQVGTQKKAGGDLKETGHVSYGCTTTTTLIPFFNGKTTTYIPNVNTFCSGEHDYSLVYDQDGQVRRFEKQ